MTAAADQQFSAPPVTKQDRTEISEIEEVDEFKRFDVVSDHSDHSYALWKTKDKPTAASTDLQKMIMKEWRILENHLPESIFVRVYEDRIDLMRAAIVGVPGTPYHDGLFIFDIFFPEDYPNQPPSVHYRSFGTNINPNLYQGGTVCLSLLNTWNGLKSEKWVANQSTIYQVLLSIQALVLNEEPFFNEPMIVRWMPGTRKSSRLYNESVFSQSCSIMAWLIQKKPKGFEDLVTAHFRERARKVLAACEAYANGRVLVGFHGIHAEENPGTVQVSEEFRAWMKDEYPKLVSAFRQCGPCVHGLPDKLELLPLPTSREKKKSFVSEIFGIFKMIVGIQDKKKNINSTSSSQVIPNPKS